MDIKIVKKRKVKNLSLSITENGVVLTAPKYVPNFLINNFIKEKTGWIQENLKNLVKKDNSDYLLRKEEARKIILSRVEYFSKLYGYRYNDVRIKNNSSNFGSCSKLGNLNFNYKIAFFDSELLDYIVVHELCHLKEFNHSQKFWDLVEIQIPNYKALRKKLKRPII